MIDFDEVTQYFLFALRGDRGWKLANGNLKTLEAAQLAESELRANGVKTRLTARTVTVL